MATPREPKKTPGVLNRQRRDGTWYFQVRWRAGGRRDGQPQSVNLNTKTDAVAFHAALRANGFHHPEHYRVANGQLLPAEDTASPRRRRRTSNSRTVTDLFTDMMEARAREKGRYSEGSRRVAEAWRDWRNWVAPEFGDMNPTDVDEDQVQDWVDDCEGQRSAATVKKFYDLLSGAYDHGVRDRGTWADIKWNPCAAVQLSPPKKRSRRGLDPANWQYLYAAAQQHDADTADLLLYLVGTGWRWSEVAALRVNQFIDMGAGDMFVEMTRVQRRTVAGVDIEVEDDGKSDAASRTIRLSPVVEDMVRRRLTGRQPTDLMFTAPQGGPLRYNNFRRRLWVPIVEAARAAGMSQSPTPHWLRHSHATWLLRTGKTAQLGVTRRVGHAQESTTALYQSMYDDVPAAALDALDEFLAVSPVDARTGSA